MAIGAPSHIELFAAGVFSVALVHTFSTKYFERLAYLRPAHAGVWHLLGEVEVVFGFWAMVLVVAMLLSSGARDATGYLDSLNFTEPMFVFAIMVVAGSRPILHVANQCVRGLARVLPLERPLALYVTSLAFVPLLGSFITEPAAMTLAALILRDAFFTRGLSSRLKYVTVGVLFVNVSIGGTLTNFAAPPVLMVAGTWQWDTAYMLTHFGWRSALAVLVNAAGAAFLFRRELAALGTMPEPATPPLPPAVVFAHLLFLVGVVVFAHHPPVFMGLLLFFLGFTSAYQKYQDRLILREGLLVAFFLAGLVVLGGQQRWWLEPLLRGMDANTVYFGATLLTAVTDNAALTYLGSLVDGISEEFKRALVAGAVTGGGLTVIANAPNPAGFSILRSSFDEGGINPLGLLLAALVPTLVAVGAFRLL